jgi:hypothetical protein
MVLDVVSDSRRDFLAGLIAWHGPQEPLGIDLEGCEVVAQGVGHVKMILEGYGWITGELPARVTPPQALLWADHLGCREWGLYRGLDLVQRVDPDAAEKYPRRRTWGYNVINILAAKQSKRHNRVPVTDYESQPRVPHHRAYGSVHGGSARTRDEPA